MPKCLWTGPTTPVFTEFTPEPGVLGPRPEPPRPLKFIAVIFAWLAAWTVVAPLAAQVLERDLPANYTPGVPLAVTLTATPGELTQVYAVEEALPAGWTPVTGTISHGGVYDSIHSRLRWGPFIESPALTRVLTYSVRPQTNSQGGAIFSGTGQFNAASLTTGGDRQTDRFPGTLFRRIATDYVPGQTIPVELQATPAANVVAYAVEESVPAGWSAAAVSHGGFWDAASGRVKWGPFIESPAIARTLSFSLTPPTNSSGTKTLSGRAIFDATDVPAVGPQALPRRASTLTATISAAYHPGAAFPVTLIAGPAPYVAVYSVQLEIPAGWSVSSVSHSGFFDAANRRVKWGPFFGNPPVGASLSCTVTPPVGTDGEYLLSASGAFDDLAVETNAPIRRFRVVEESSAVRVLPAEYRPGEALDISIDVSPRDGTAVYAVEETLPAGWLPVAGQVSDNGSFDSANGKLKWGPFIAPATSPRTLTYRVLPPGDSRGEASFRGSVLSDAVVVPVSGPSNTVAPAGRILRDFAERFTTGAAFQVGLQVTPISETNAVAIEEAVPAGWTFASASEGGRFDAVTRKVKWGPFTDGHRRTLTYSVTPPTNSSPEVVFNGLGVFNRFVVTPTGSTNAARNRPPSGASRAATRTPGRLLKVSVFDVLQDAVDPDGDFLNVTGVVTPSTNGAAVSLSWPWIFYSPASGYNGPDRFECIISDRFGGSTTVSVHVSVEQAASLRLNLLSVTPEGAATRVVFAVLPGFSYRIEAGTNLVNWESLGVRAASTNGLVDFLDGGALAFPVRYYRTVEP